MPTYNFEPLSDADFEELACDLMGAELSLKFQLFTKGRDKGIDLLSGARINNGIVVQCKHYARSTYSSLCRSIKQEAEKLSSIKPNRYILVTSQRLTPGNKEELLRILAPYCRGIDDIYGLNEVNTLLRKHASIETSHYKLWLTSMPVLNRVLRNGAAVWNAMTKEEIAHKMSLYVQTDAFPDALNVLRQHGYCILSGIPGIGKTTLGRV